MPEFDKTAQGVRPPSPDIGLLNLKVLWTAASVVLGLAACAELPVERKDSSPGLDPASHQVLPVSVPIGALNPDVSQSNIRTTICVPGWTASVRPSTTYTNGVKLKLLRESGLPTSDATHYELDHFVPLALGGHPRSVANLWLQPWEGAWGAKTKDRLERKLQKLVCSDRLQLAAAQAAVMKDWRQAYRRFVEPVDLLGPSEITD